MGGGLPPIAVCQSLSALTGPSPSGASPLPHWSFAVSEAVDNSALFDFDRAFPTVDVALAGSGYCELGLIHILIDG